VTDPGRQPSGGDGWGESAGWEASAKLRRARALAMSDDERLRVVEEMIRMAVASGAFRAKRPHAAE
jgi:hypothetical protein